MYKQFICGFQKKHFFELIILSNMLKKQNLKNANNKRNRSLFIKIILVFLALTSFFNPPIYSQSQIRQADYYVDGSNGNDSDNGLTPTTAKQSIAGIIALGSAIAGKTIAFRDSITYRNSTTLDVWRLDYNGVTVTNWYEGGSDKLPKFTGGIKVSDFTNYSGNVWQATAASASAVWLTFADSCVWGEQMGSISALVREGQYYISGSTMYLYAPSDPDNFYESVDRNDRVNIFYFNTGQNITLSYVEVYGSTNFNIFFNESAINGLVEYCNSHHAGTYANLLIGAGSHCIQTRGDNTILRYNKFWQGTNHGLHLYPMLTDLSGVILEHNEVYNNHHTGIDLNSSGPTISGTIIRYNHVYETLWSRERQFAGYGSGSRQLGCWQQGTMVQSTTYAYNLLENNARGNLTLNGSGNVCYNNTSVNTVNQLSSYNGVAFYSNGGIAKNNIVVTTDTRTPISGFSTTSNNITYRYGVSGTDPQFSDYNNLDFHLSVGSPAIDYGVDVGYTLDYDGNTIVDEPDAGCCEYTDIGTDMTPPQVVSASLTNSKTLVINFSEALNSNSDQNANNYQISNGIIVISASLNGNKVTLTTAPHITGSYVVTVNNVTDIAGNVINPNHNTANYNYSAEDVTLPQVVSASLTNSTTLVINFSEILDLATAQNINNYSINNGINVSSAVLSGTQVTLSTSAHKDGAYTVTVNNVTDISGNIINPTNNNANYNYASDDVTPPQVVSATLIDSVTLNIYFSENLESGGAQNINNYSVNSISIINATLNTNVVTLSTSIHSTGNYSVIVSNVTDLAGNVVDPQQNSGSYEYQSDPTSGLIILPVSTVFASVAPEPNHTGDKTLDGNGYYQNDPDSRWAGDTMPEWLVYDLGDIQLLKVTKLSFYKWNEGRTYNYSIQVSIDSLNWTTVRSNTVSIINQEWSIETIGPIDAKYIKIAFISNNQNDWAGLWEAEFWGSLNLSTLKFDAKVFLEGAFQDTQMHNYLNILGLIPPQQPYSQSPWNYNGNELLQTIPSEMVDWVLVELRTSTSASSSVYKKAGIILQDGSIKSTDGISPLSLDGLDEGNYYIVIYHRNHLPILSSFPINFSSTITNYDFTTSMAQAYGIEPLKEIGSGVYGMIAGDGDGNGGITIVDRNQFWQLQNGNLGYLSGDFSLDGGVTIKDCNQYWNINNGKASQVP